MKTYRVTFTPEAITETRYAFIELSNESTDTMAAIHFNNYTNTDGNFRIESIEEVHFSVGQCETYEIDSFVSKEDAYKMLAYYRGLFINIGRYNCVEYNNEYGQVLCFTINTSNSGLITLNAHTNCFEDEKHFNETLSRLLKQEARKNVATFWL